MKNISSHIVWYLQKHMTCFVLVCAIFCFISLFSLAPDVNAAQPIPEISFEQILDSATKDDHLARLKEMDHYTRRAPQSTPYLDKVELRTETQEFDLSKQKYSMRFYPKAWGETACLKAAQDMKVTSMALSYADRLNTVLKKRYDLIIDYLETTRRIDLEKALLANYEDQIHILRTKGPGSLNFDITNLTGVQDAHMNHRLEVNKLENRFTGLSYQISDLTGIAGPFKLPADDVIPVSGVVVFLKQYKEEFDDNNLRLNDRKHKIAMAQQEYELEVAKSKDYFSFIDVSYDSDHYGEADKAVAVELAFRLPFIHKDRSDIHKKKVSWVEEKLKYQEARRALSEKQVAVRRGIERFLDQYALLSIRKSDGEAATSFEIFRQMDGVNPLDMLKIKESMLKNDIQIAVTRFEILRRYIDLVDLGGMLSSEPQVNYLSFVRGDIS